MDKPSMAIEAEVEAYRAFVRGPPWILGHRGAPREAPENTLAALRRALELGLDGVEYDLQALRDGEAVLLHDDTLERTTNRSGPIGALALPEIAGIDAGGWFHKRFAGEPLPLFTEALELPVAAGEAAPLHMIEVKDPALVAEVARRVAEFQGRITARLASFDRGACVEARALGLQAMLLAEQASEADRRFVRDEGLAAYSVGPGGWSAELFAQEWPCERWAWSLDEPAELLWAARAPLFGWNTNEPHRALAARALAALAPGSTAWPVELDALEVEPDPRAAGRHGAWSGRWQPGLRLHNPFPWKVEAVVALLVRGGAFEVDGLPARLALEAGGRAELAFRVAGGSWSPGEDPRVLVRFSWSARGPRSARGARELVLDTTLERRRSVAIGADTERVALLVERPGDRPATMVLCRRGGELLVRVEDAGGLADVRAEVRVGSAIRRGARGVRISLPTDFDQRKQGVPFSCGFEGRDRDGHVVRVRFAGGVPGGIAHGAPGRLFPAKKA
jgi:glycerophosphoryl diester phosphodiesterase